MGRTLCTHLHLFVAFAASLASQVMQVAGAEVIFPSGAKVIDITKAPYNATPNDESDDTAAIQKALTDNVNLIYIPNGIYIVSETLRWGKNEKRQIMQGQSEGVSILRLKDTCQGFGDASQPKAMLWTGKSPAQRFRNSIRNLTVDTGNGNPGAIGAQFIANNQGGIFNVTFRSGSTDGSGPIGLDLGYSDEQGPCLIRDVTVVGFDVGVSTKHAVDSVVFERLTLRGQRKAGFVNDGQCISMRGLRSENAVPAYVNVAGPSLTALIDAELTYTGDAPAAEMPAIQNDAGLFARNIKTTGYGTAIRSTGGNKQDAHGPMVDEFVSHAVLSNFPTPPRSLNLPVEETPTVPWGDVKEWTSVADFGPPVEVTLIHNKTGKKTVRNDWSVPLQKAIDSGATTVYFPWIEGTNEYGIYGPVRMRGNLRRIIGCETNGANIVSSTVVKTDYQPELRANFILEDGKAPAVIVERFSTWYASPRFEQRSKRALIISSMSICDLETEPGSGDVFLDDVRMKDLVVRGSRVYARQLNPEGFEEPRIDNDGGQVWILGLKTEGPRTLCVTRNGGKTEIVGGFFYANSRSEVPIRMFVNDASSFSVTGGGWKTNKGRAFDVVVEETRGGETRQLKKQETYGRGESSMIPLYVGYPTKAAAVPAVPIGAAAWAEGSSQIVATWKVPILGADGVQVDQLITPHPPSLLTPAWLESNFLSVALSKSDDRRTVLLPRSQRD